MKIKILAIPWWMSMIALGGAMDAEPVSWIAVALVFAAFIAISTVIIREQRRSAPKQ